MSKKFKKKEIEAILKHYAGRHYDISREKRPDCPDAEKLSLYICGFLNKAQEREIKKHLAECVCCIEELAEINEVIESPYEKGEKHEVTPSVAEEIKDLIPGKDILDSRQDILFKDKVKCAQCGTKTLASHKYCFECGYSIAGEFICPYCSVPVKKGDVYCYCCGKKIVASSKKVREIMENFSDFIPKDIKENKWLLAFVASMLGSFAFPAVFMQFLVAAGLFGGKWLLDPRKIEKMREIYMIWKKGDEKSAMKEVKKLKKDIEKQETK